jgi:predicted nucleic acid-binding protein
MIVIDASVAFKWFKTIKENFVDEADKLLALHLAQKQTIIVPDLLPVEIANALTTKSAASEKAIRIDINKLYELNLKIHKTSQKNLVEASLLAKKHKTSVYDMLYAVVAKEHNTILYTSDNNFIKKTRFRHVKHISEVKLEN